MAELMNTFTGRASLGMTGNSDPLPRFDAGRFCRRFLLLGTLTFVIASLLPDWCLEPINRFTANGAALILDLCGMPAMVDKATVSAGSFSAVIIPECTPLFMAALFCSFLLAAPAPVWRKLPGLIAGIAVLTALDLVRIAVSIAVGRSHPSLFGFAHAYLGQAVMLIATWGVCMVWLRTVLPLPFLDRVPSFLVRFVAISSLLFIAWLPLSKWYIRCVDAVVRLLLSLFGFSLAVSYHRSVYLQTFSLTAFAALILATRALSPWRKIKGVCSGLLLLFCTHLLFRSADMLLPMLRLSPASGMKTFLMTAVNPAFLNKISILLNVAGELLIPIILWLAIVSKGKKTASAACRQSDHITSRRFALNQHPSRPIPPWWR